MNGHLSEEQRLALLHGALVADERAAARAHLADCALCAESLAREAAVDELLFAARRELSTCAACGAVAFTARRCSGCGAALRAGDFRVVGFIGHTERSRLYRAEDDDGRRVALKEVMAPIGLDPAERLAALEREGRMLRQLDHPAIPRFIASFIEGEGADARYYLAQELIDGRSLLARMEERRFTESDASDLARQVLEVLVYLQGLSPPVFHRDVKPANLVEGPGGRLALVDFGAARDLGATFGGTLVGTFGYMPVEQLAGIVDRTTDLYALGATLVHLLTRRPPWERTGAGDVLQGASLSPRFARFLRKLLAANASQRFASAREALAALPTVEARPRRRLPVAARWLAGGLVAAALAGGGAVAALALRGHGQRSEMRSAYPRMHDHEHDIAAKVDMARRLANALQEVDPPPGPIGVSECDSYLRQMQSCAILLPRPLAEEIADKAAKLRIAWRTITGTRSARASLSRACAKVIDTSATAYATFGCVFVHPDEEIAPVPPVPPVAPVPPVPPERP